MVYTLWADDLVTLWHGIGRTIAPLVMNNKRKIILNLLIIFFGCVLPFLLFPITLSISIQLSNGLFIQNIQENLSHPELYLPVLNLTICLFVFGFALMKNSARGIPFVYTLGAPFGSGFVFVVCLYNIAMLLLLEKLDPYYGRAGNIHVLRAIRICTIESNDLCANSSQPSLSKNCYNKNMLDSLQCSYQQVNPQIDCVVISLTPILHHMTLFLYLVRK